MIRTSAAIAITVQRETSPREGNHDPFKTAIQRASRSRRSVSQRPARSCRSRSRAGCTPSRQRYHAGAVSQVRPLGAHSRLRRACVAPVQKEPVDRRAGARDVGAERAQLAQLGGKRRRREVVRRGARRGRADGEPGERVAQGVAPLGESALHRRARRRRRRRRAGRRLRRAVRDGRARPSSPAAGRAAASAVPSPSRAAGRRARKNGTSAPSARRELVQARRSEAARPAARSRGGAPSPRRSCRRRARPRRGSASGSSREARLVAGCRGDRLERSADERVLREPLDGELRRALDHDRSASATRWYTVTTSCLPSARSGPTTSARLIFAVAAPRLTASASRQLDELGRGELLRTHGSRSRPISSSAATAASRGASPASSSELASVLRRCANARLDDRLDPSEVGRQAGPAERDERRVDVGPRPEDGARDGVEARARRGELDQHGDRPVRLRRRLGEEAGPRPRAAPSRTTARSRAGRRGSRRRSASRRCRGGSRRASSRAGASVARSSLSASPKWSSTFGRPPRRSASCGSSERSSSTAWTRATRSAR